MKNLLFVLLLVAALFLAVTVSPVQAGEEKIDICHLPPGNPENVQIITIGISALEAHLAHGDNTVGHGCAVQ